jgi:glutaredoxin-related protein
MRDNTMSTKNVNEFLQLRKTSNFFAMTKSAAVGMGRSTEMLV